jgi:hypothetical protein
MTEADAAGERLDETDRAILDHVRTAHALVDPPPGDLNARVRFAIALENADIELARLADDVLVGSGARSTERTRTMTFDADSLTVMVAVADITDAELRLDGWLAPAGALRVELRIAGAGPDVRRASRQTRADEAGRFVFDGVGHGLVQLLVHREGGAEPGAGTAASVVTPSFML